MLAGISHDLRTPLTRLRLEAELSVSDESARKAVIEDIEQMEAVISQFMDYARTNLGEEPVATDLCAAGLPGLRGRATGRVRLPGIAIRFGTSRTSSETVAIPRSRHEEPRTRISLRDVRQRPRW